MRFTALLLLPPVLGIAAPLRAGDAPGSRHVVLITVDGLRPRELFSGVDPTLLESREKSGIESPGPFRDRYWRESARERRESVFPFFWRTFAPRGMVLGNRALGSRVVLRNRHRFSYPGYAELLTGRPQESVTSNEKIRIGVPTVLDFAHEALSAGRGAVAAFASWEVFDFIVTHRKGSIVSNAGYEMLPRELCTDPMWTFNELQMTTLTPWDTVRHDTVTAGLALGYLEEHEPRLLYLALGETDDWAHARRYDRVIEMARFFDETLRRLWKVLESREPYRGRTTVIITTDHGRGLTPDEWTDHGESVPGAEEIWLAIVGPDTPARGELGPAPTVALANVAATVLRHLGLDPAEYDPAAEAPVEAILDTAETDTERTEDHPEQTGSMWRFPPTDELPETEVLPDPFERLDGTRITSPAEWAARRREIRAQLLHYQYGFMPPAPGNVRAEEMSLRTVLEGAATEKRIVLSFGPGHTLELRVGMIVPEGPGPFPVVVKNDVSLGHVPIAGDLVRRGYAICEYVRTDLDPDERDLVGPAQAAYPGYDWGTLAVWAWGGMRVVDYLLTQPFVDPGRIAVTGHSRGGKVALLTGALDERVSLTAPNGSGAGGAACYRVQGAEPETLELITRPERFGYWFVPRLREFAGRESRLPFDQHFLRALVAPRAVLSTDARDDLWANPLGAQQAWLAAQPVFEFLGAGDQNGIFLREGGHDQTVADWLALLDFMELRFFGREPPGGRRFDRAPFPDSGPTFEWTPPETTPGARREARISPRTR